MAILGVPSVCHLLYSSVIRARSSEQVNSARGVYPYRVYLYSAFQQQSAFGFGNLVPFESSLRWGALFWICGPRLLNVATGGVWDLFVLLPKILGCWGFFARAFLLGRLVILLIGKE